MDGAQLKVVGLFRRVIWPYGLLLLLVLMGAWLPGCKTGKPGTRANNTPSFYEQLQLLCGKKITGEVLYPAGAEAPFRGMDIWLEVNQCTDQEIRMPVYIDRKIYRTLILSRDATGYTLRHEQKRANGTQADFSLYGGHSTGDDTGYLLVFPADGYTKQLMGADLNSVWSLAFNNDKTTLSYIAETDGKLNLQLDFNLTGQTAQ